MGFCTEMMKIFFLSALFTLSSFSSPRAISFSDEQTKIMWLFNSLNASMRLNRSGHCYNNNFKDNFKLLLDLDSVTFLNGMGNATDKIFLFTFWNTFNSHDLFLCSAKYNKKTLKRFEDFVEQLYFSNNQKVCASDMLYHFKKYLIKAMATCQGGEIAKRNMLFEAEDFYTLKLKGLILEVLNDLTNIELSGQIEEMYQNFRFFHQCTEKENLLPMLIREFRMFKGALKADKKLIEMHTENMAFMAGILTHDRSTIYGLQLIADQPAEFVRFFLLMQYYQTRFLRRPFVIRKNEPEIYRNEILGYLFEKIPVFGHQAFKKPRKFDPLKKFTNNYGDILNDEDLIDLARTLYTVIIS
jgi:hypothetical protein